MVYKNPKIIELVKESEKELQPVFEKINETELFNLEKVLNAMHEEGLEERHFVGSTGYGHNDIGKDITNRIFARTFNAESAYVSPLFTSGTGAISHTILGILRPNDTMCCITGTPYDTLATLISSDENNGCLKDYNINYDEIALTENEDFDYDSIKKYLLNHQPKMIYIQRSRGYSWRNALTIEKIKKVISFVKELSKAYVVVDNCYGEFVDTKEPTDVGADIIVGSMIKNIGGGIAPTGGYVVGNAMLVEKIACHLTSPALGLETGSYELGYRKFLQGLFSAPHIVSECKKIVRLTSLVFTKLGYKCKPSPLDIMSDIVCAIKLKNEEDLIEYCRGIQEVSPVDSNAVLEPSDMPGYADQVIMASGSFTLGSSIELSCDAPIREPYIAYMQGGLSYAHGKLGLINALSKINK